MTPTTDRILSVSTIRDTVPNARWFVERTLASGVDHMIVFLDQKQPAVYHALDANPHVTVVPTAKDYWHGERPLKVEERQSVNATLANAVCAVMPTVGWLFHFDCDEALDFDREALLASDEHVVRFPTREVVAEAEASDRDRLRFKKLPSQSQLLALAGLGAIREPDLDWYLRGHAAGKSGLRPHLQRRMTVHVVTDDQGTKVPAATPPGAHLLHYDSWCVDDLAGRWQDFNRRKAARSNHRDRRKRLGLAVSAVVNHPVLDDDARREVLTELFRRHVADDVQSLTALDLVTDKAWPARDPHGLEAGELATLEGILAALRPHSKAAFRSDAEPGAVLEHMEWVARNTEDRALAGRVLDVTAAHRAPATDAEREVETG